MTTWKISFPLFIAKDIEFNSKYCFKMFSPLKNLTEL